MEQIYLEQMDMEKLRQMFLCPGKNNVIDELVGQN